MESFIEEDANISKFRRRNNIIITLFLILIISSALIIAALILDLLRFHNSPPHPLAISPIKAFCSLSGDDDLCLKTLNPIIKNKFISDPNQIFTLSLQTAADDLQLIILSNLSDPDSPDFACSNSLRHGLDQIRDPLVKMRVNPFVESLSEEQRREMVERIRAAEEDVASCLDVGTAKLFEAKVCLKAAADFLSGGYVLRVYTGDIFAVERGIVGMIYEIVFTTGMCGLQLLFMFGMFCALYRIR